MGKGPEQTLSQRRCMNNQVYEKVINLTTHQGIKTKTMIKPQYHLMFVRMAIIKIQDKKCWRGYGKKGILVYCWWDCGLVPATMGNSVKFAQKIKNRTTM